MADDLLAALALVHEENERALGRINAAVDHISEINARAERYQRHLGHIRDALLLIAAVSLAVIAVITLCAAS